MCYSSYSGLNPEGEGMASVGDHLVWVADGDPAARMVLEQHLYDLRCRFQFLRDLSELLARLHLELPSLLLLDTGFGGGDCLHLLPELLLDHPKLRVVVLAAHGSIGDAVRAIKLGAFEYLPKPPEAYRLREVLHHPDDTPHLPPVLPNGVPTIDQLERQAILAALRQTRGKVRDAARLLGFGQATVYRKIKRFKIALESFS
jgi:two-component system response regulator RegA